MIFSVPWTTLMVHASNNRAFHHLLLCTIVMPTPPLNSKIDILGVSLSRWEDSRSFVYFSHLIYMLGTFFLDEEKRQRGTKMTGAWIRYYSCTKWQVKCCSTEDLKKLHSKKTFRLQRNTDQFHDTIVGTRYTIPNRIEITTFNFVCIKFNLTLYYDNSIYAITPEFQICTWNPISIKNWIFISNGIFCWCASEEHLLVVQCHRHVAICYVMIWSEAVAVFVLLNDGGRPNVSER